MHLSKRLQTIADMIPQNCCLADIGTDHAYIPIWLAANHRISHAIAMDVNRGPLERANDHIQSYGLESKIDTRLSDGLMQLKQGEADVVLIAGMGGGLMSRIIDDGQEVLQSVHTLILQPQSEICEFRHFLHQHDYIIADECMLIDEHKYYTVLKVEHGRESYPEETDYIYGHLLLERKDPVLHEFLKKELSVSQKILTQLQSHHTEQALTRIKEIELKIHYGNEALSIYE